MCFCRCGRGADGVGWGLGLIFLFLLCPCPMTPSPRPIPFFWVWRKKFFYFYTLHLLEPFAFGGGKNVSCLVGCSILWQVGGHFSIFWYIDRFSHKMSSLVNIQSPPAPPPTLPSFLLSGPRTYSTQIQTPSFFSLQSIPTLGDSLPPFPRQLVLFSQSSIFPFLLLWSCIYREVLTY